VQQKHVHWNFTASLNFLGFIQSIYNFSLLLHSDGPSCKTSEKEFTWSQKLSQTRWSASADACVALKE
jgi:hypothetical protein